MNIARKYTVKGWNNHVFKRSPGNLALNRFTFSTKSIKPEEKSEFEKFKGKDYKPSNEKFEEYRGKTIKDPDTALMYCRDLVKKYDYYTHIVSEHFPKSKQPYFYAIHAFFLEILKSREASRNPGVSKRRLLWWSETLEDIEKGKEVVEPIGIAVQQLYKNTKVNFDLLHRIISYQIFDLERSEMQTMNELTIYGENTRSLTFYMYLHLLKIDDKNAYSAASHMGRCVGIIDVLRKMQ